MLSSISWQHYLAAVIILTASYYAYVALRYYQTEIAGLFNRKPSALESFSGFQSSPISVMGKAKPDYGTAISDSTEMQFAEATPDDGFPAADISPSRTDSVQQAGQPGEELETEARKLIDAFKETDNKPEFLSLLHILIESYQAYNEDIDLPATVARLVAFAEGRLPFSITAGDVKSSWA
jgi:hypothetical protein